MISLIFYSEASCPPSALYRVRVSRVYSTEKTVTVHPYASMRLDWAAGVPLPFSPCCGVAGVAGVVGVVWHRHTLRKSGVDDGLISRLHSTSVLYLPYACMWEIRNTYFVPYSTSTSKSI